jgi:predicted ATPase
LRVLCSLSKEESVRIKELILKDFGPFKNYRISFIEQNEVCVLLTGKNNEGKSNIINSLKLLNAATRVINKTKQEISINGNYYYKLLRQDTEGILIGRMIHNYSKNTAQIIGIFHDHFKIKVYLDPKNEIIYAENEGRLPSDVQNIFGFIPPLGLLSENEDIVSKESYLRASIDTSLAPRHLRNHFCQVLSEEEFDLVKHLIKKSWRGIELLNFEVDYRQGKIYCYYKEERVEREISWAGQGLQVWFQIVTHLVRLRNSSILILDEPEINLHPEKQNDLIRLLKDYFTGSVVIATHSVEIMNNVSVSHIINIQKKCNEPKIKSAKDRSYLNFVRSQIGSNFNLIASQFEEFDVIIFTEDIFDYSIIQQVADNFKIRKKAFNIPIHGFSEYQKCIHYKKAYELLIGKKIDYTSLLDRDYYPEEYLSAVRSRLVSEGIRVVFTPGKEIENLFLSDCVLNKLIPAAFSKDFRLVWENIFSSHRLDCYGSFLALHKQFLDRKLDIKTVTTKYSIIFDNCWTNFSRRHKIIDGKEALKTVRGFYRTRMHTNLTQAMLIDKLTGAGDQDVERFIEEIYHIRAMNDQVLHY